MSDPKVFNLYEQQDMVPIRAGKTSKTRRGGEEDLNFKVTGITVFNTMPRRYSLEIAPTACESGKMEIGDATLVRVARFKKAYRECFNRIPLGMPTTTREWERIVDAWLVRSVVVDPPPEPSGLEELCETLTDELRKMPVSQDYTEAELDSSKALVTSGGERIFKGTALRCILKADGGDVTKKAMGVALRRVGCRSKSVRIDKGPVHVWAIPEELWNDAA